jgi:hypothetical protein
LWSGLSVPGYRLRDQPGQMLTAVRVSFLDRHHHPMSGPLAGMLGIRELRVDRTHLLGQ